MSVSSKILQKSESFYNAYERKQGGDPISTHYCPGCGHGIIHKLIAEALDDFGVQDKGIFVSPVGCSVFAYYYFDVGNIQAAHGRAPAVGTGYARANPDSVVISYQGDGDLAAIGANEIIQAANRGERMTVIFVNNAIYGMTGGQMAPTTLIGQRTTTTPLGRSVENEGFPIRMSEIISTLEAPVYVARTKLTDTKSINNTRNAIRKAIKSQVDGLGFSFVEILTACPTGWKMTPQDSKTWIDETMTKYFVPGIYKDLLKERQPRETVNKTVDPKDYHDLLDITTASLASQEGVLPVPPVKEMLEEIKIAGFGGQGVLSLGYVMANIAMGHNYEVSWLPSYGPEMRGGTANCSVKVSHKRIGAPVVAHPSTLIALNKPSLAKFENDITSDGIIIYDNSLIDEPPLRKDIMVYAVPATELADKIGSTKAANMVMLGAYAALRGYLDPAYIEWAIPQIIKKKKLQEVNIKAFQTGMEHIAGLLEKSGN